MQSKRVSFRQGSQVERLPGERATLPTTLPKFDGSSLVPSEFAPACDVAILFRWRHLGPIVRGEHGKPLFPVAPKAPGLYCMQVGGQVYIGEAVELRRRFGNYRNPGPTQQTSLRINALLREALEDGALILLDVAYDDVTLVISDRSFPADLTNKTVRRLAEQAAIVAHGGIDVDLLNR